MLTNFRKSDKGFTLVELLVVVVILVALAAIAIPIFTDQSAKATAAADKTTVSNAASFVSAGIADGSLASGTNPMTSDAGKFGKPAGMTVTADKAAGTFCVYYAGYKYSDSTGGVVTASSC